MKLLSYILSPIFSLAFFLLLVVFHPIQWLGLKLFGGNGHQKVVEIMNWFLIQSLLILGVRVKVTNNQNLPKNVPLIFVANHQSMFDISMIVWYMRKISPHFVSKMELGKGIPSISYNLRHGGSVLIDRSNKRQSLAKLMEFGKRLHKNNETGVIFPEGTRSRDGVPKTFSESGLKILTRSMPNGYVIPVTLNNSWKLMRYGNFPIGGFSNVTLEVHEPIKIDSCTFDELLERTKRQITLAIK